MANSIKSLQHQLTSHQVLKALRVEGAFPQGPDDPAWAQAEVDALIQHLRKLCACKGKEG
jgi:hypothetical protein